MRAWLPLLKFLLAHWHSKNGMLQKLQILTHQAKSMIRKFCIAHFFFVTARTLANQIMCSSRKPTICQCLQRKTRLSFWGKFIALSKFLFCIIWNTHKCTKWSSGTYTLRCGYHSIFWTFRFIRQLLSAWGDWQNEFFTFRRQNNTWNTLISVKTISTTTFCFSTRWVEKL